VTRQSGCTDVTIVLQGFELLIEWMQQRRMAEYITCHVKINCRKFPTYSLSEAQWTQTDRSHCCWCPFSLNCWIHIQIHEYICTRHPLWLKVSKIN
jgi:hypothetical protein